MAKSIIESVPRVEKKMKHLVMIALMGLFCISNVSYAANGDLTVGGSLEMTSSENAFLPPRMTTSARGNITPSPGMLIYNTDDNGYNYYSGSGWNVLASSLPVHDNTGATSDYALAVGETAKITYTNATSVPLHIAITEGEYEIIVVGSSRTTSGSYSGSGSLQPNNTTYANRFGGGFMFIDSNDSDTGSVQTPASWKEGFNMNQFYISDGVVLSNILKIHNWITNKCIDYVTQNRLGATTGRHRTGSYSWNDTTTSWSSLGTLTFPFAQSGKVIVRRLI